MLQTIAPYAKAAVALLGALVVLATALSDGKLDNTDVVAVLAAFGSAVGVYQIKNK